MTIHATFFEITALNSFLNAEVTFRSLKVIGSAWDDSKKIYDFLIMFHSNYIRPYLVGPCCFQVVARYWPKISNFLPYLTHSPRGFPLEFCNIKMPKKLEC